MQSHLFLSLFFIHHIYGEGLEKLKIGTLHHPNECTKKAQKGDKLTVNYKGYLVDGKVFDSSFERNQPFSFVLGASQVIQGWDLGLLDACLGSKRKLQIPSHLGYGSRGVGSSIPPNADLIFEVEVLKIEKGHGQTEETDELETEEEEL